MLSLQKGSGAVRRQIAFGSSPMAFATGGSDTEAEEPIIAQPSDTLEDSDDDDAGLMDLPPFEELMSPLNEIILDDNDDYGKSSGKSNLVVDLSDDVDFSDDDDEGDENASLVRELSALESLAADATAELLALEMNASSPSRVEPAAFLTVELDHGSSPTRAGALGEVPQVIAHSAQSDAATDVVTSKFVFTRLSEVTTEGELRKHSLNLIGKEAQASVFVECLGRDAGKASTNRAIVKLTRSSRLSDDDVISLLNRTLLHGSTIRCCSSFSVETPAASEMVSFQISKLNKKTTRDALRKHLSRVLGAIPSTTMVSTEMRQNKRHTGNVATVKVKTSSPVHEIISLVNKSKFMGSTLMAYETKANDMASPRLGPTPHPTTRRGGDRVRKDTINLTGSGSSVVTASTVASKDDDSLTFNVSGIQLGTTSAELSEHMSGKFDNDVVIESLVLKRNQRKTGQVATVVARGHTCHIVEGMSRIHKSDLHGKLLSAYKQAAPLANHNHHHPHHDDTESVTNASTGHVGKKKRTRKRTEKERAQIEEAKELAELFHMDLLCSLNEDLNVDREDVALLFRKFLSGFSADDRSEQEKRRLETLVVMNMRQRQLIRSRRYDDKVVLTIAGMGGPGDFPSEDADECGTKRVLERRALEEEDKNGVTVTPKSSCDDPIVLPLAGTTRFELTIKSDDATATLQAIGLGGSSARLFSFDPPITDPTKVGRDGLKVGVKFEAEDRTCGVGVKRAIVKMGFVTPTGRCIITRSLAVSVQTDEAH